MDVSLGSIFTAAPYLEKYGGGFERLTQIPNPPPKCFSLFSNEGIEAALMRAKDKVFVVFTKNHIYACSGESILSKWKRRKF